MNNLVYDEIHLSNDKSVLFNDLSAVVDDSPSVLDKAKASGSSGWLTMSLERKHRSSAL